MMTKVTAAYVDIFLMLKKMITEHSHVSIMEC